MLANHCAVKHQTPQPSLTNKRLAVLRRKNLVEWQANGKDSTLDLAIQFTIPC